MQSRYSLVAVARTVLVSFLTLSFLLVSSIPAEVFAEESAGTTEISNATTPPADTPVSEIENTNPETVTPNDDTEPPVEESAEQLTEVSDPEAVDTEEDPEKAPVEELEPESMAAMGAGGASGSGDASPLKTSLVDSTSGSFQTNYGIVVPPGRNGMQPNLSLGYDGGANSQTSVFGYGWDISIPYISRMNKTGSENLYATSSYFYSSLSGELVPTGVTNEYRARVESGSFLKYVYSNSVWTVTDKSGRTYTFGSASTTRQDNPSDSNQIYRWYIAEERDTNNNAISYSYYKNAGQIYPDTIYYTKNGADNGIFSVQFERESRTDVVTSYQARFAVKSNYRIKKIVAYVDGVAARSYALAYTNGDNQKRSLLSTITESGTEGSVTTTRLAQSFEYKNTSTEGWTSTSTWSTPEPFSSNSLDTGLRLVDVNGDSYQDLVRFYGTQGGQEFKSIYINNGLNGWTSTTTWNWSDMNLWFSVEGSTQNSRNDYGTRFLDVNGDGLTDAITGFDNLDGWSDYKVVYINNGSGWASSTWVLPVFITKKLGGSSTYDLGVRTGDINGDRLPDIVVSYVNGSGATSQEVYLNNGQNGWSQTTSWVVPEPFTNCATCTNPGLDLGTHLIDVNGDGLDDVVRSYSTSGTSTNKVYLNTGTNWVLDSSVQLPTYFVMTGDSGLRWVEVNGDGLIDLVRNATTSRVTYLNSGTGWTSLGQLPPTQMPFITTSGDSGVRAVDIDGDGQSDLIGNTGSTTYLNSRGFGDSLTQITFPQGGKIIASYQGSAEYRSGSQILNPKIPYTFTTVSQIQYDSNNDAIWTESYLYEDGFYHYASTSFRDRTFSGFGKITKTSPRAKTVSYYHQNNDTNSSNGETTDSYAKIGLEYKTFVNDLAGNNYITNVTKWSESALPGGASYISQQSQATLSHDGDSDHRDMAVEYSYDTNNGNLLQKIEYGEVTGATDGTFTDTGTDKYTTAFTYGASSTNPLFTLTIQASTTDQQNVLTRLTKYYYDNSTFGSVTKGNLTKQEDWATSTTYSTRQWEYNTFGLVGTTTDPRGNVSSVRYDSHNLYPSLAKNALGHITTSTYDYSNGQVKTNIDANSALYTFNYDGLDRLLEEYVPDPNNGSSTVLKNAYTYFDTSLPYRVHQSRYLNQYLTVDSNTYLDGFGQVIQTRQDMEQFNKYAVTDFVYDDGVLIRESVPYQANGSGYSPSTSNTNRLRTYSYDALDRKITIADMRGTSTLAYDQWQTLATDPLSRTKKTNNDAYGNLVSVIERNSGVDYTTTYTYDYGGKLTSLTDALSNVRKFTYDGLGRRLYAEDLHVATSSSFGVWRYQYDLAGNLGTSTNPRGQIVAYTYDALNRTLTENAASSTGVETSYTYDSCTKGVGKLCTVVVAFATTTYGYNNLGSMATETKQIRGTTYTTSYQYDRQGNQTMVQYPDNSVVRNTYNNAGLLDKVEQKENGGLFKNVVTALDYSPAQKVTLEAIANGATTTKTYDSIHRLTNILTTTTGTTTPSQCPSYILGSGLDTNLISYWNHNEYSSGSGAVTRFDSKGTNHLTDFNTTLSTVGMIDTASDLEVANTERLTITDAAQTGLDTQNDMTFATWLKFESLPGTNGRMYVVQKEDIFKFAPDFDVNGTDYLRLYLRDASGYYHNSVSWVPFVDTWYHVAFTRNQTTGALKFYVNGQQQGSTIMTGRTASLLNSVEDFNIGANPGEFDGAVDETAIWSRVLTDTEIACLYNNGGGISYSLGGIGGGGEAMRLLAMSESEQILKSADYSGSDTQEITVKTDITASSTIAAYDVYKQQLNSADASEKATLKGQMIAEKVISGRRVDRKEFKIDLFGVEPIDGGLQVYLRAFDAQGNQLGFGKDGTIDIERFKIYNPPISVPDGTYRDEEIEKLSGGTQIIKSPNFKDDPEEALYQVLEQTIKLTGKSGTKIVPKKIGRTTSVFYPDANPESSSVDGWTQYESTQISWSAIRTANGTGSGDTDATRYVLAAAAGTATSTFNNLRRGIFVFNTAPIADTDYISGATLSFVATAKGDHDAINERFANLTSASTASNVAIAASDYQSQSVHTTKLSTDKSIKYDIVADSSTYTDWTLNSDGLANISTSSVSKFGLRFVEDISSTTMPWNSGYNYGISIRLADTANTSLDPKLVVEHSATSSPVATTTTIQNIAYTYDAVDNITQITDTSTTLAAKTVQFTYDDLNRLTRASTTVASSTPFLEQYTYNAIGNLLTKTGQGTYSYAGTGFANPHAPTTIGTSTLTYDQNGNLASYNGVTYTSNYKNQLTTLTKNSTTTKYTYDHQGQRLEKARGTGTTTYASGGYEVAPTGVTKYIYAGGELVATIAGIGTTTTTTTSYIHRDHLSSTNVTTNQSGGVSTVLDYYPYGSTRIETGTPPQKQYIGQYDDSESDLAYLNARYYDPTRGQFTSQDPMHWAIPANLIVDPQLQNSYGYAKNNPIIYKDPNGDIPVLVALFGGAALAGAIGQGIEDIASGQLSGWQDYAGAAAGGMTGMAAALTTKNPFAIGGVTSGSEQLYTNLLTGEEAMSDVFSESGKGIIFGGFIDLRIPLLSKGANNISARTQSIITKVSNGTVSNASLKTVRNVSISQSVNSTAQSTYNGVEHRLSNSQVKNASNNIEKATKAFQSGNYTVSLRYLEKANQNLNSNKKKK
ncbi:MAG: LamG-like jellyroll fold domain-containing protein [Candidatus Paceibacteria bacterium]